MAVPIFPVSLGKPLLSSYHYADNLGNISRSPKGFGFQTQKAIGKTGLSTFYSEFVWNDTQMTTFKNFYKDDLLNGHKFFTMDLYTGAGYIESTVRITTEKYKAILISPIAWRVSFTVETREKNLISQIAYEFLTGYDSIEELAEDVGYLYDYSNSIPSAYTTKLLKDDFDISLWP